MDEIDSFFDTDGGGKQCLEGGCGEISTRYAFSTQILVRLEGGCACLEEPTPKTREKHVAVGQNQWYRFGVGALVYFSGDWDVHWGYGILTHGHVFLENGGLRPPFGWSFRGNQKETDLRGPLF